MKVYNSLTRKIEQFVPINSSQILMYLCGPTVYDYVTIGNCRTYFLGDILHRTLKFNGYNVRYIMNLTDVGHLTGDNDGDADAGEDRLEKAAKKEGRNARDIADYYIADFFRSYDRLNYLKPARFTRATDYIEEQIELIKVLERKGLTYKISDGIYFDTTKYKDYGLLSGYTEESIKEGARLEPNPEKRNPADFALWKFSPIDVIRWQEWDSPWGVGFPGWHIECSAMSLKELGTTLDFHLGGEDLRMVHHQNEIAQSECATGKTFVNYWMHSAFLQVDGGRMGKSLGNAYTVDDIVNKNYNPLALRYLYMTAHYRSKLNFTWESLNSAQQSLRHLYELVSSYAEDKKAEISKTHFEQFTEAINDDLNMPKALAVMWDLVKSDASEASKLKTLTKMDSVLGLNIDSYIGFEVPQNIVDMAKARSEYKKAGIWDKADSLRREIEKAGFILEDTGAETKIKRRI